MCAGTIQAGPQVHDHDDDEEGLAPPLVGHNQDDASAWATSAINTAAARYRCLDVFLDRPDGKATSAEVGKVIGMNTNLVGARFVELRGEYRTKKLPVLIRRTEPAEYRDLPGTSKRCRVHELTDLGRMVAQDRRKRLEAADRGDL